MATTATSANASGPSQYSAGTLAGVGAGIGVPLLLAFLTALFLLFKERRKNKYVEHTPLAQKSQEGYIPDHKNELHAPTTNNADYRNTPQFASYEVDGSNPRRAELPM